MKKILIIATMLSCLFVFWCNKHWWTENEWFFYDNILSVEWIFQDIENHVMAEEWTLVLNGYFDDHADHIYFPKWMREEYLKSENDYLPWNKIKFMWDLKEIDAWAWNHYYEVIDVYKMEVKWYPTKSDIEEIVDWYNFCETESDCIDFDPGCDFDCSMPVNVLYKDIATRIVTNYNNLNNINCKRDCPTTVQMACENNKCVALTQKPMIECTQEDREQKECSSQFEPVCGDNWAWYNNPCLACKADGVNEYSMWWCNWISYFIKWTPKNLEYVLWLLKNQWSVSCDMTYKFKWEDLHWKIIADSKRLYINRDIYYDWKIYHNYSLLSVNWKRYEWLKELPIINTAYEFTFEIPNEIEWELTAAEVFEDFNIECHAWIDDENTFNIPSDIKFSVE